jgi:hypothetical protein
MLINEEEADETEQRKRLQGGLEELDTTWTTYELVQIHKLSDTSPS